MGHCCSSSSEKVYSETITNAESKSPDREDARQPLTRIKSDGTLAEPRPGDGADSRCKGPDGAVDSGVSAFETSDRADGSKKAKELGYWYYDIGASVRARSWRVMEVASNTGEVHLVLSR